jgi:ATP-binding cassette subfamily B protein
MSLPLAADAPRPLGREIPKKPLAFTWWAIRDRWRLVAVCWSAVLIAVLLTRAEFYLFKELIDAATGLADETRTISQVWFFALLLPAIYLVGEAFWRTSGFTAQRWMTGATAKVYDELFRYLTGHGASFFQERFAGAITNKIANAAQGVQGLLQMWTWSFQTLILGIAFDTYLLFSTHYYFAVALLIWLVIFMSVNLKMVFGLRKLAYLHAEASSTLKGKYVDSTANIETVQQQAQEAYERNYVQKYIQRERMAHIASWFRFEWILVINGFLLGAFYVGMFALSVFLFDREIITLGAIVMVVTIVFNLERNLFFLGEQMSRAMQLYGQIDEGLGEILKPHDITVPAQAPQLALQGGNIVFQAVTFQYGEQPVFSDLALEIPGGQKVGLVGPSGAGKSTLVNLLLRQFDVQSGSILIDGQDIAAIDLGSLRHSIALVPQSTSLLHRTLAENIRYGRLAATDEELYEAAQMAHASEFIAQLPQGFDTFVGERGVKLSGGQRQRIAIARAILKDAPILVLDEATSALDSESEHAIQEALEKLMVGRTVIAIAHRLSTLQQMDRILVLEGGKIVEDGSHVELIKRDGLYKRLWDSQVGGFLQEGLEDVEEA